MIVLDDGHARVEVLSESGAGIGRFDRTVGGTLEPIFQTAVSPGRTGPFALGLNILVPFSNRISRGGFRHDGVFHPLERNTAGPYPVHGNGYTAQWAVRAQSAQAATLTLSSVGPGPFRYDAEVTYALHDGALRARLSTTNRAEVSLPYGAGFHPWFVRTPGSLLALGASGYWTQTPEHLPDKHFPTAGDPAFDFTVARPLPASFTNCAFTGWNGRATLYWPERNLGVEVGAPPPIGTLIVYSPSGDSDFVCIEPVTHSVDAHNRSDPGTAKPHILQAGEMLVIEASFTPFAL